MPCRSSAVNALPVPLRFSPASVKVSLANGESALFAEFTNVFDEDHFIPILAIDQIVNQFLGQ